MVNVLMYISFDGTDFQGWQYQKNGRTVQDDTEQALRTITGQFIRVTGCGRTDAGVHAKEYALNFQYDNSKTDLVKLIKGLNAVLKDDIGVLRANIVNDDFNARFSSHYKIYSYTLINRKMPLLRKFSWRIKNMPERSFIEKNKKYFIGKYNGSALCVKKSIPDNPWIHIEDIYMEELEDYGIKIFFKGRRFLHNTIRIIVGTFVDVYNGRIQMPFDDIIKSENRDNAGITAQPQGLCLEKVIYETI